MVSLKTYLFHVVVRIRIVHGFLFSKILELFKSKTLVYQD